MMMDEFWAELARSTRAALLLLGREVPDCLPGEPEPCGGTFAEHVLAHLATLQAIIDHHRSHLDPPAETWQAVYDAEAADIAARCEAAEADR